MSKILLIGGNGYIGSKLQEVLDVDVIDANWFNDNDTGQDFSELTYRHYSDYNTIILLLGWTHKIFLL